MCPMCIATVAWIAGTTSTGGLSTLVLNRLRGKNQEPTTGTTNKEEIWTRTMKPRRR
jgi:hypothetical protein